MSFKFDQVCTCHQRSEKGAPPSAEYGPRAANEDISARTAVVVSPSYRNVARANTAKHRSTTTNRLPLPRLLASSALFALTDKHTRLPSSLSKTVATASREVTGQRERRNTERRTAHARRMKTFLQAIVISLSYRNVAWANKAKHRSTFVVWKARETRRTMPKQPSAKITLNAR